jgi:hypothetical protein
MFDACKSFGSGMCVLTPAGGRQSENARTHSVNTRFTRESFAIPHVHTDYLDLSFLSRRRHTGDERGHISHTHRGTMMGIDQKASSCLPCGVQGLSQD